MVSGTCGCKEYFEEDRSDTESLKPKPSNLVFTPIMAPPMAVHDMHIPPPPPVAPLPNPEPATGYPMQPVFQQPLQMQMPQPAMLTGGMGGVPQMAMGMPGLPYPPQPPMGAGVPGVPFPQPVYPQAGAGMMPMPVPQGMPGMMPGMAPGRPGLPVFGTPNGQPNPIGPPGGGIPGQPPFVMQPMAPQNASI